MAVSSTVMIGHMEGKPMTASKIAHYLALPRTTVLRKLEILTEVGVIERRRRVYYVCNTMTLCNVSRYVDRVVRVIDDAAHDVRALNP